MSANRAENKCKLARHAQIAFGGRILLHLRGTVPFFTTKGFMKNPIAFGQDLGLSRPHTALLARLKTPEAVQDYITQLEINFEPEGDTCLSVAEVLKQKRAHCIEGAFVAACALWMQGRQPLLMDMQADGDDDHVIAPFVHNGFWGAISKSNHVWLRWRDPVYRSLRELAMSYFHEYTSGARKTLRSYSAPFNLRRHDPALWVSNKEPCWDIAAALDASRHYPLVTPAQAKQLKRRDETELRADKVLEYARP